MARRSIAAAAASCVLIVSAFAQTPEEPVAQPEVAAVTGTDAPTESESISPQACRQRLGFPRNLMSVAYRTSRGVVRRVGDLLKPGPAPERANLPLCPRERAVET